MKELKCKSCGNEVDEGDTCFIMRDKDGEFLFCSDECVANWVSSEMEVPYKDDKEEWDEFVNDYGVEK